MNAYRKSLIAACTTFTAHSFLSPQGRTHARAPSGQEKRKLTSQRVCEFSSSARNPDYLPGFRGRIDRMLGRSPGECRKGQHAPTWRKAADDQLAAYTDVPADQKPRRSSRSPCALRVLSRRVRRMTPKRRTRRGEWVPSPEQDKAEVVRAVLTRREIGVVTSAAAETARDHRHATLLLWPGGRNPAATHFHSAG
jgi:hypothetical protein